MPFSFSHSLGYFGLTYDFTPDLSTTVYAGPAGQADLYFLRARN